MSRKKPPALLAAETARPIPTFLELKVGNGSKRTLIQALERDGCYVGRCAREMIARASFSATERPRNLKLARTQLSALGVNDWVTWNDVLKTVARAGGEKVPAEAAARLRLELPDQQPGDHFWILM